MEMASLSVYKGILNRGHFYLSLKDEKSVVKSVMFATYARRLRFLPEDGMKVIARGHIGVYEPTADICQTKRRADHRRYPDLRRVGQRGRVGPWGVVPVG